jgi:hypothetical protein
MLPLNVSFQIVSPPKPLDRILAFNFRTQILWYPNGSGMVNGYVSVHVPVFGCAVSAGRRCWTRDRFEMLLLVSSIGIVGEQ